MISPIRKVKVIKILSEYSTVGSGPLKVIGDDDNLYVAKFTDQAHPYCELINEVICGYMGQIWEINTPEVVILEFSDEVASNFKFTSDRYKLEYFKIPFFGSKIVEESTDFGTYIGVLTKSEYEKFEKPLDFLKIGCFDYWIGNKDRKVENTNIIISLNESDKKRLHAIDHTAAFGHLANYNDVRDIMLQLTNSIMDAGFTKSIVKFEETGRIVELKKNIELCIENTLPCIDDIFEQVPREWGFSKKSKAKLKLFFSDEARNLRISNSYIPYIRK